MSRKKIHSGGFVLVEFAIALPLLILLMCGLATMSVWLFELGKDQLASYALETEAQYVMGRITQEARAAREIEIHHYTDKVDKIKIVYRTVKDNNETFDFKDEDNNRYYMFSDKDVLETQFFIPRREEDGTYKSLNAKRKDDGYLTSPITSDNAFGDTKINILQYELDEEKKLLHITLEMESLVTAHKIKIATAVFMLGYGD